MSEQRPTLLDALVDLAVYAPLGLALTAKDELPELIAKGRSRIEPQLGTARLVGQFVVAEGRRRAIKFSGLGGVGSHPSPAGKAANREPDGHSPAERSPASASKGTEAPARRPRTAGGSVASTPHPGTTSDVPDAGSLAIPGYDSLSASQVVQRLAGLSPSELSAVGVYEAANRGRRTILARVAQLQGA